MARVTWKRKTKFQCLQTLEEGVHNDSVVVIRRRERKQQKFKSQGSAQRFLSSHGGIYNTFNVQPHLVSRPGLRTLRAEAHQEWEAATQAA